MYADPQNAFDVSNFGRPVMAGQAMQQGNPLAAMAIANPQPSMNGLSYPMVPLSLGQPVNAPQSGNALAQLADSSDPRRGSGVAEQTSSLDNIGYELKGKERPNKPDAGLQSILSRAATTALGDGARVVIYSGQENPGHQHGSNRHKTGLAADVRVYTPDGQLLRLNDPRAEAFATTAASLGARGIGAGAGYMGDAFHIDTVPHEDYTAGQGPVWGEWAKQRRGELLAAMNL